MKLLLDRGADIEAQNYVSTRYVLKLSSNYAFIFMFLYYIRRLRSHYLSHLYYALVLTHSIMIQSGWTSLMFASHKGHTEAVKLLLDRGANPNTKNNVSTSDSIYSIYTVYILKHIHYICMYIISKVYLNRKVITLFRMGTLLWLMPKTMKSHSFLSVWKPLYAPRLHFS
jgi:hypothetical protein